MKPVRILIVILFIMAITFTFSKAVDASDSRKPYGGTLVWGTCHKPTIINPVLTTSSVSASLVQLIFNGLVRINSKGQIEPDLAESWEVSSDGLVYTFYLKKGVRFHDGKELTADDVKFTYKNIISPEINSPFSSLFQFVDRFEVIDRYTFRAFLKKPSVSFIYRMTKYIMPRHILENKDLRKSDFNFHPIGTGPFKFKEWTEDNQIILEYNLDYYEGRPYLDKIIVKSYSDSKELWVALMRAEVDFVEFIEKGDYEVIKNDSSFKAYTIPADGYYAITYNLDNHILVDRTIREAIAYGVDRKSLVERAADGYGLECCGPFCPESLGFNAEVKAFEYNPKKAQELLAQVGWQDKDNDGILEKDNKELAIRVLVDSRNDIYKKIIMIIRQQLQEIGIKIRVVLYDNNNQLTEEFLKQNKPKAYLKFLQAGYPEDIAEEWCYKESKRFGKLWVYKNEEVDRLFELGEVTQDNKKRQEIYQGIHQLIYQDQPACFLYFPFVFHSISSKFENIDEFFTLSMPHYTMKDWHLGERG